MRRVEEEKLIREALRNAYRDVELSPSARTRIQQMIDESRTLAHDSMPMASYAATRSRRKASLAIAACFVLAVAFVVPFAISPLNSETPVADSQQMRAGGLYSSPDMPLYRSSPRLGLENGDSDSTDSAILGVSPSPGDGRLNVSDGFEDNDANELPAEDVSAEDKILPSDRNLDEFDDQNATDMHTEFVIPVPTSDSATKLDHGNFIEPDNWDEFDRENLAWYEYVSSTDLETGSLTIRFVRSDGSTLANVPVLFDGGVSYTDEEGKLFDKKIVAPGQYTAHVDWSADGSEDRWLGAILYLIPEQLGSEITLVME